MKAKCRKESKNSCRAHSMPIQADQINLLKNILINIRLGDVERSFSN
jgi:hypothetical protein